MKYTQHRLFKPLLALLVSLLILFVVRRGMGQIFDYLFSIHWTISVVFLVLSISLPIWAVYTYDSWYNNSTHKNDEHTIEE